jgi:hypothetical protein
MTTARSTATTAWARVRLETGESSDKLWDVSSDTAEARVDIGSSPVCAWVVRARGVAPRHVELFWNGSTLWVGNATGDGSVRIDGKTFSEWHQVSGSLRLEFGEAVMFVEAKNESPPLATTSAFTPPTDPKATSWDTANDATIVHADTQLPRPSEVHYSPAPSSSGGVAAPRVPPPPKRNIPAPPPSRKVPPTREAAAPSSRVSDLLPATPSRPPAYFDESTRIRPDLAPSIASPVAGALASFEEETRFPIERPVPAPATTPVVTHSRETPAQSPAPLPTDNPFVPPPPPEAEPAVKVFQQLTEKLQAIRTSQRLSVPLRTWALLFAVVIMGSYALAVVRQKRLDAEAAATPRASAATQERRTPPPSVETTGAQANAGDMTELARQGAAKLFSGRLAEALPVYRDLAARDAQNPAYVVVVRSLEKRLGLCANGGTSCAR